MGEHVIKVTPVSASGIGNYLSVEVDGILYKSTETQNVMTKEVMDAAIEEICTALNDEVMVEAVRYEYNELLNAMENAANEPAVASDPMMENFDEAI